MDWLDFFLGVLTALVWPLVVLVVLLLFHEPIGKLIPNIKQLDIGILKAVLKETKEETAGVTAGPEFHLTPEDAAKVVARVDTPDEVMAAARATPDFMLAIIPAMGTIAMGTVTKLPRLRLPAHAHVPHRFTVFAASHPLPAIQAAWKRLQMAVRRRAGSLSTEEHEDLVAALDAIQSRVRVPAALFCLIFRLESLERQARAAAPGSISASEAMEYTELAQRAIVALRTVEFP